MKSYVMFAMILSFAIPLFADNVYYVAPQGSPSAAGTEDDPFDFETGFGKLTVNKVQELRLKSGTYKVGSVVMNANYNMSTIRGMGESRGETVLDFEGKQNQIKVMALSYIENLTISNFAGTANNAFVHVNNVLTNVTVCCGRTGDNAPAIWLGANAKLIDCEIRDITGGYAYSPAVYAPSSGTIISGCTFSGNNYTGWTGSGGTSIYYMDAKNSVLNNCVFTNNISSGVAGAVYVSGSGAFTGLTAADCVFYFNSAASHGGGALNVATSEGMTNSIADCRFIGNSTIGKTSGGAVRVIGADSFTEMTNCTFKSNVSGYMGGAIYIDQTPELVLSDCSFEENVATNRGGAITHAGYGRPCVIRQNCIFRGNLAANTSESYGGAISSCGPADGQIVRLIVLDSTFEDNIATTQGGAIGPDYSSASLFGFVCAITNCTFRRNLACSGGAISTIGGSYSGCLFEDNLATNRFAASYDSCSGGAFYSMARGTVTHPGVSNRLDFVDCTFKRNLAYSRYGGSALYLFRGHYTYSQRPAFVVGCTFIGNKVVSSYQQPFQSALLIEDTLSDVLVERCRFEANYASTSGSAMGVRNTAKCPLSDTFRTIRNSLFLCNTNENYYWCGALEVVENTTVENCSFIKNVAISGGSGAAIHIQDGAAGVSVRNCLFNGNDDANDRYDYWDDIWPNPSPYKESVYTSYCASDHDVFLADNRNRYVVNPNFVDAKMGDYRLKKPSACIDTGHNEPWMVGAKDLQNDRKIDRILGNAVDIGCYEFRPTSGLFLLIR